MKNRVMPLVGVVITIILFFQGNDKPSYSANHNPNSLSLGIAEIMAHPEARGSIIGISIRDAEDGTILYSHNGDTRLQPASGMKLVTAASALDLLGPDYQFSTEVYTDGEQEGKVLNGNVYLKGKGDPTLQIEDLSALAGELKRSGIHTINGNLVADDHWYDSERLSIDMPWSDEQEHYGASISALTASPDSDFDAGTVEMKVTPGKRTGKPVKVTVTPNNQYIKVSNSAVTGSPGSKKTLEITRIHGTNEIQIKGNVSLDSKSSKTWISVWNPTEYVTDLFTQSLANQEIVWNGKQTYGTVPAHAILLAKDKSIPLSDILVPFMKLSNNTIAEGLVKEVGRVKGEEGSWPEGLKIIEDELANLGVDVFGIRMRDGSGLSPIGMVTANNLTGLLYNVQEKSWFTVFEKSLPIAGNSEKLTGGTLRNRMIDTAAEGNVVAKTGTITFNSSLSGYVTTKNGNKLIFSCIINNGINETNLKKIEDRFAVFLAELSM